MSQSKTSAKAEAPAKPAKTASQKPASKVGEKKKAAGDGVAETVRIIPAPVSAALPEANLSASELACSEKVKLLAADIERAIRDGESSVVVDPAALQAMMAALCRVYSAHVEAGLNYSTFSDRDPVTPTDVMVTASGLLKAANLAVFELGMWQSWTGR